MGTEREQSTDENQKTSTHHVSYIPVPGTCIIPGATAICSNESNTVHDTTPQRRERHGTARC